LEALEILSDSVTSSGLKLLASLKSLEELSINGPMDDETLELLLLVGSVPPLSFSFPFLLSFLLW
jgi:hypothetical protein